MTRTLLIALAALSLGGTSVSAEITDRWPLLAFDRPPDCELQLVSSGKIIEIRASGLIPGESLRFTLTNGDMKPIDWQVYADGSGRWKKLYIPFRFGHDGGTVTAGIAASRCTLSASAPWTRGVRTID